MKMKIIFLLCILCTGALQLRAQSQQDIKAIFDTYGKQQGSVLVQLSADILSIGSNMSLYKSLMIDRISDQNKKAIVTKLSTAKEKWTVLSEVSEGEEVQSGSYHMGNYRGIEEYLLVKNENQKLTIVYIRGNFAPNQLNDELKKLKKLFIYSNNQKLKIN